LKERRKKTMTYNSKVTERCKVGRFLFGPKFYKKVGIEIKRSSDCIFRIMNRDYLSNYNLN